MDLILIYDQMKQFVKENGWDEFLLLLQNEFPAHRLYAVSQGWYYDGSKYICKARGTRGDVIVGWHGIHNTIREVV